MKLKPTEEPGILDSTKLKHPAFGAISAHRINGMTDLFGSHVPHSGFVRISISSAELHRSGYDETVFARERLCEVDLSEAQWVAMISRMNMGGGTPCTFRCRPTGIESAPSIDMSKDPSEKLENFVDSMSEKNKENQLFWISKLSDLGSKMNKRDQTELGKVIEGLMSYVTNNQKFAKQMLTEHKEKLVTEAKLELEAHVQQVIVRSGIAAINSASELAVLEDKSR